jgi:transcriptional regulator with XRE-family HTH domain
MTSSRRSAGAGDVEIGRRLRERRLELGLSQESVAESLGLTFQQLQKYEKGVNRVAATTLVRLAKVLQTRPEALLPGAEAPASLVMSAKVKRVAGVFEDLSTSELRQCMVLLMDRLAAADRAGVTRSPPRKKRG